MKNFELTSLKIITFLHRYLMPIVSTLVFCFFFDFCVFFFDFRRSRWEFGRSVDDISYRDQWLQRADERGLKEWGREVSKHQFALTPTNSGETNLELTIQVSIPLVSCA